MSLLSNRSAMVLFHDDIGHRSQKVRIVIAEKGITCNLEVLSKDDLPKEILEINPDGHLPLLVDRELSLYHSGLIVEYLDERFPHPPLLPVYPVSRAQFRLILQRIEKDWAENLDVLENINSSKPQITKARNNLQKNISNSLAMFDNKKFFRSDEFSVLDAVIIPILLRLEHHQIKIPNNKASKPLFDYIERMQDLPSVKESFTSLEIELLYKFFSINEDLHPWRELFPMIWSPAHL